MITVVSGHPRSGTSMMMQMLVAGGVPVWADTMKRDEDNPRGYYEVPTNEPGITDFAGYLRRADGCAIKVTALSLHVLPTGSCRIIYMHRDLNNVHQSFEKYQRRRGRPVPSTPMIASITRFGREVAGILGPVLDLNYAFVLASPSDTVDLVSKFLGQTLDPHAVTVPQR